MISLVEPFGPSDLFYFVLFFAHSEGGMFIIP